MIFDRPRPPTIILVLIALTLVTSLAVAMDARAGGELYRWLALSPVHVWRGELWRLVTWTFVELGPWSLVVGCVSLYWFGGDLVAAWGSRRFAGYAAATVLIAGVGTSLLAVVLPPAAHRIHLGGWPLDDALVIAWALQFPARGIRIFYGTLVVRGTVLAHGLAGFTLLCALFFGVGAMLPHVLACATALTHMQGWPRLPRAPRTPPRRPRGPYHVPDDPHDRAN